MFRDFILMIFTAAVLMTGCTYIPAETTAALPPDTSESAADNIPEETVEFNGITKKRSELSEDTLKWLDWYQKLPQEQQAALNFVPSELYHDIFPGSGERAVAALETDQEVPAYASSLTEEELQDTAELARYYFTELSPEFEGVEQLMPAEDTYPLYQNAGIEKEYAPGNIIIYLVETVKDKEEGNPMRSISIARRSKSDEWKVINSGY